MTSDFSPALFGEEISVDEEEADENNHESEEDKEGKSMMILLIPAMKTVLTTTNCNAYAAQDLELQGARNNAYYDDE